jgi:hypothetical protein
MNSTQPLYDPLSIDHAMVSGRIWSLKSVVEKRGVCDDKRYSEGDALKLTVLVIVEAILFGARTLMPHANNQRLPEMLKPLGEYQYRTTSFIVRDDWLLDDIDWCDRRPSFLHSQRSEGRSLGAAGFLLHFDRHGSLDGLLGDGYECSQRGRQLARRAD